MSKNRRPVKTRSSGWAKRFAELLASKKISPNQISVASIGFAAIAAFAILLGPSVAGSIVCILGIQMRLLCNLFDGMVAIEGGMKSPVGAIYNEFPDRIADSLLIVALGYAAGCPELGWLSALVAALTAYIRVFGGSLGLEQDFQGPMAKQQRMAVMTAGLLVNIVETSVYSAHFALLGALIIIFVGSCVTCITRTRSISRKLQEGHHAD